MDDEVPGVPEWVVTYGDMMSLLLTFFIMLVSLSDVKADAKYRAVLESLQKYTGYRTSPTTPPGKNFPLNSMISRMRTLGSFRDKKDKKKNRGGIKNQSVVGKHVRIFRTREGTVLRVGEPVIFAPNDATLSPEAIEQLMKAAAEIVGKPNKIEIRAYAAPAAQATDTSFDEQLVLTYQRARNVLRFPEQQGIIHERLRISAAADSEPVPNTGDKRSRQQDRAEILIFDAFAKDFVGPRAVPN